MITLALFCPDCTLWLVLMLLGAWILGWLFWSLFLGSQYQATIRELRPQVEDLKTKNTELRSSLSDEKYKLEKRENEYSSLRATHMDLDLKYKVRGEQLAAANQATEELQARYDQLIADRDS